MKCDAGTLPISPKDVMDHLPNANFAEILNYFNCIPADNEVTFCSHCIFICDLKLETFVTKYQNKN